MQHTLHPGVRPDARDDRDRRFTPQSRALPHMVDLSQQCGTVYDQGDLHSCSANALASAIAMLAHQRGENVAPPSRLFMYYNAREALGEAARDCGTTMRAAIKAVAKSGACAETLWPYDPAAVLKKPPESCYAHADVRSIVYERIERDITHMQASLAQGYPFVFAIQAYADPFTAAAKSGELKLPVAGEACMGGHALVAVGYDDAKEAFLARNSLGASFGRDGFFWVDEGYFTDAKLTYDFWSIRGVDPA